jgi:hypothetical protein
MTSSTTTPAMGALQHLTTTDTIESTRLPTTHGRNAAKHSNQHPTTSTTKPLYCHMEPIPLSSATTSDPWIASDEASATNACHPWAHIPALAANSETCLASDEQPPNPSTHQKPKMNAFPHHPKQTPATHAPPTGNKECKFAMPSYETHATTPHHYEKTATTHPIGPSNSTEKNSQSSHSQCLQKTNTNRATPDTAIITDNTLDQLPGLTPNILTPNLREHNLTMPPIWSAIVQDSTSTPDFCKQTMSEVDDQWNIPQHPYYKPKIPPYERKRPRIAKINRRNQPGRGGTAGRTRIQHPHQELSQCREHQHNTAQEHNNDETNKKDGTHQHNNDVWQAQKTDESKYELCRGSCSESQEDACDDDMKQPHKLEMTFDKEPNNPMILETNAHELNTNEPNDRMIIETNTKDLKNLKPTTDRSRL